MSNLAEMLAELEAKGTDYWPLIAAVREVIEDRDAHASLGATVALRKMKAESERDDAQRRLAEAVASNVRLIKEMDAQGQALFIADQILDGENLSVMKAERDTLKAKLAECERERSEARIGVHVLQAQLNEARGQLREARAQAEAAPRKADEALHELWVKLAEDQYWGGAQQHAITMARNAVAAALARSEGEASK